MKEINSEYGLSRLSGTVKRMMFALLSTILISNALTQGFIQTPEAFPLWGEYALLVTIFLCLALPSCYLFEKHPLACLIAKFNRQEHSEPNISELLGTLFANSSIILFSMRVEGRQLRQEWVSGDTLASLLGYSEEEAMQPDWWIAHLHPEDKASVLARAIALKST